MTTRHGIMMPFVPFASRADRDRTLLVMCPIITESAGMRQIARMPQPHRDEM